MTWGVLVDDVSVAALHTATLAARPRGASVPRYASPRRGDLLLSPAHANPAHRRRSPLVPRGPASCGRRGGGRPADQ
ncbi:hypothetical protein G6F22_018106 [Rhizopus arrhizus]|uniref:Uncharacterized protein n=1 Tax=Rhizopus delemar TaxID=936053 RepID=A0A9P7C4P2_9FUNG|nr:hypothetical protein G6F22_018106 [Rhizopus arrhizus]KAG1165249.1 hypothetical protein G6F35_018884 [Rhizopus arrhizus]KAG1535184.1 hypothetical protein G6F50_015369 [Rhizopus delemar]